MSNYKYSYLVEGQIDERIFKWLKNDVIKAKKLSLCKNPKHPKHICEGTIQLSKIKKCNECSKTIIIFDKDDIGDVNRYNKTNCLTIISDPCIEIVLLAIFCISESDTQSNNIESKLNRYLKKYNIEYKHNIESLNKILSLLERNDDLMQKWIENLERLNEYKKSNFIELYNFLQKYKEE